MSGEIWAKMEWNLGNGGEMHDVLDHGIGAILVLNCEQVLYQKLANFMVKKGIYVNRLENVIFGSM